MDTENKKRITPDIDEKKMMNLMVDGVRKDGFQVPIETSSAELPEKEKQVKRERSRIKGISPAEYEEIFFKEVKTTARHGKSVYIDPNHHKKLSRIVQLLEMITLPSMRICLIYWITTFRNLNGR